MHALTDWQAPSRTPRVAGAALAVALTLLPLAGLLQWSGPRKDGVAADTVVLLRWVTPDSEPPASAAPTAARNPPRQADVPAARRPLPAKRTEPTAARPREATAGEAPRGITTPEPATVTTAAPAPTAEAVAAASAAAASAAAAATAAARPASAPLRLDAQVLREAALASKSAVRRLGDASGTYRGDGPVSRSEQLGRSVAETAKSDCVGKDSGGAGLLSPLVMAYLAATGKCK